MADLIFNALNGPELKAAILARISKALDNTGEFEQHQTFPWVKYTFKIGVTTYPKQAMDADPGIVAEGEEHTDAPPPEPEKEPKVVEDTVVVETPDLARIESELPVPTVAKGIGGVLVDKPVVVSPEPPKAQRPGTFPKKVEAPSGPGNQTK